MSRISGRIEWAVTDVSHHRGPPIKSVVRRNDDMNVLGLDKDSLLLKKKKNNSRESKQQMLGKCNSTSKI